MNAEEVELLRRRMGEVAALSPDDPQRQAVVRQISQVDDVLEREWLELIRADERMRLDLARITPPPGLQERLLAIPNQAAVRGRWMFRPSRWISALAAVLLLAAGLWGWTSVKKHQEARAVKLVATITMASHETEPEVAMVSSDWEKVRLTFQPSVYYPLDLPTMDPSWKLVGATVMQLGGKTMLYTRWERAKERCSLYQFCGKEFGVNAPVPRQELKPVANANVKVIVWTENHCDYALVIEQDSAVTGTEQQAGLQPISWSEHAA